MRFVRSIGSVFGRVWEYSNACRLGDIYELVIYCSDASEGRRAVCHTVFEPVLDALISLDNVILQVIAAEVPTNKQLHKSSRLTGSPYLPCLPWMIVKQTRQC
jgi:hypothetical protein